MAGPLDLVFAAGGRAPLELVFGDGAGDAPQYLIAGGGQVTGLAGVANLRAVYPVQGGGTVTGLAGALRLAYDINVPRPLLARGRGAAQLAQPIVRPTRSSWQPSRPLAAAVRAGAQPALPRVLLARSGFERTRTLGGAWRAAAQPGLPALLAVRAGFERAITITHAWSAGAQLALPLLAGVRGGFQQTLRRHSAWQQLAQPGLPLARAWPQPMHVAQSLRLGWRPHWQVARHPPPGAAVAVPPEPPRDWCYEPALPIDLLFAPDERAPLALLFLCDRHGGEPELPPASIVVPVRRVYVVINEIDLRRVDGNLSLPAYTLALSLDADSWTWTWSATLHKAALPLLAPAQAGTPVEVQATVNGVHYRLLVESVRRAREFASTRIEVSGRGLAALLDAPYAPAMSFGNAAQVNAEQLMQQVLTLNGVGIGWGVDFGLADWLIPAGVFSHQGTWISAINTIAQAAGGYVQPHPTAKTLRILHRYPQAPWDWGAVTPDIELPQAPVQVEGVEWVTKPDYNRVFLTGEAATELYDVKRGGTPGDIEASPVVVEPLLISADVAAQRGRAILSDTGPQAVVTLTLQVLPETGLILPGTFIRRTDAGEVLQGIVRSMSLAWDAPRMRQTLEVQTHA